MHGGVGVPDRHPGLGEEAGGRGLAHADRAGEAEPIGPRGHASTAARSAASTSGRRPNQRSKPGTAWCSSMPRPSTATRPRRARFEHEGRRLGAVDEVGDQRARRDARRGRAASSGSPAMPSEVVLTMVAASPPPPAGVAPSRRTATRGPKCAAQRLGAGAGAVGDADLRARPRRAAPRRSPRAAPPAPSTSAGPAAAPPVRRLLAQVGDEAVAVGIVGVDRAVGAEGQGVGGADRGGAVARGGGQRQRRLLVRDGDVHAAEAERRQRAQARLEALRRQADRDVVAVDAVARAASGRAAAASANGRSASRSRRRGAARRSFGARSRGCAGSREARGAAGP